MSTPLTFKTKRLRVDLYAAGITVQQVADKANVSRITASNVLNGHYVNTTVIEAALELLKTK
jgi:transcriptional regulator with XRE-family HTH domain